MLKNKFIKIMTFVFVLTFFVVAISSVCAVEVPNEIGTPNAQPGNRLEGIDTVAKNVWKTISTIVQFLAIGAVVFAGVRYMFASADQKADIKQQTVILIVGAVLVFGATTIADLISKAANSAF
ncbi:MAG: TrbC/VirB2 family protein [Clostridia bacterium]|nr:TrbC/VirB2 family protein [Clostridia bacterium]MDD4375173.1 TrbC/VirB2 family protein [Clostridia bacterium]